ncbi:MAG TPA: ParA family protein [Anaerolineae bacterium]|nr:ParA family protein [Anaerolineae bacterium]HQH38401.1 ParA family protein [Anaerolineae bacterium]
MRRVYTFTNQKGGVGKTTTVVNIAAAMADWGRRVLLVDIDPQSNATTCVGLDARTLSASIYDVLVGEQNVMEVIGKTRWPGLDIVPSTPSLAGATVELNRTADPRERGEYLKHILTPVEDYDYILIDSPPSLGVLTVNALSAAHAVIVPVQCEYLALEGLAQLMRTIGLVQRGLNPTLTLRGVVVTMYDSRTTLSRQVAEEIRRHFPGQVFNVTIPRSVRLSEAPSFGEPGVFYAPHSSGALAYRILTWELLRGDGYTPDWSPPPLEPED